MKIPPGLSPPKAESALPAVGGAGCQTGVCPVRITGVCLWLSPRRYRWLVDTGLFFDIVKHPGLLQSAVFLIFYFVDDLPH